MGKPTMLPLNRPGITCNSLVLAECEPTNQRLDAFAAPKVIINYYDATSQSERWTAIAGTEMNSSESNAAGNFHPNAPRLNCAN